MKEPPKAFDFKFNEQLKRKEIASLVFRKYCDYQKHILVKELLNNWSIQGEHERNRFLSTLISDRESLWKTVFEAMRINLSENESAQMEFRKAYLRLKFDRIWNSEIKKIENEHNTIMGAILAFFKPSIHQSKLANVNPL